MSRKSKNQENMVKIGNLMVVSHTQDLKEVVRATSSLIKKHKNIISPDAPVLDMFG